MKEIDTTPIAPGVGYPFPKKGLDFLQSAYKEAISNLAQSLIDDIPSTTIGYVLFGCIKTLISGSDYSLSAGAIYFNGEIYPVPAISSLTITTAPILNIVDNPDPVADPTVFTDTSLKNVHRVRTMSLVNGSLGSGDLNFDDLVFLNKWVGYTPTFQAYDDTGTVIPSGISVTNPVAVYKYSPNGLDIYMTSVDVDIAAGVNYISPSLPFAIPSGKTALGVGATQLYLSSGAGVSVVSSIGYDSAGRGEPFMIKKTDNSNFAPLSNYTLKLSIHIAFA